MSPEDRSKLETALGRLKEAHKSNNVEEMKSAMEQVNATWNEIATKLYGQGGAAGAGPGAAGAAGAQPGGGATGGTTSEEPQGGTSEGKVEDADYEVIDEDDKKN